MDGLAAPIKDKRNDYKYKKEYCNRQSNEPYIQGSYKHHAILRLWEGEVNPDDSASLPRLRLQRRGLAPPHRSISERTRGLFYLYKWYCPACHTWQLSVPLFYRLPLVLNLSQFQEGFRYLLPLNL